MNERLRTTRGRLLLGALLVLVLGGGAATGLGLQSASAARERTAQTILDERQTLAAVAAGADAAAARQELVDEATDLADHYSGVLEASDGAANDSVRAQLSAALVLLRDATASGTDAQLAATSVTVNKTGRVVENAIVGDASHLARVAAEAEAARIAAGVAAEEARAVQAAADAEAARVAAAEKEAARVEAAAEAEAARIAAAEQARLAAAAAAAAAAASVTP